MNQVNPLPNEKDLLAQRAAEWLIELSSDAVSSERIAEWIQWLEADKAHKRIFEQIEVVSRLSAQLTQVRWPTDEEVARDEYAGDQSLGTWLERRAPLAYSGDARSSPPSWVLARKRTFGLAGSILLLATVILGWLYGPLLGVALWGDSQIPLSTAVGEVRTLSLPDGSVVTAGADTALAVVLRKHSRLVTLDHGEAFFRVAKDRARPFTVRVGSAAVTAVGTAFDVRQTKSQTKNGAVVAVAEGAVRVSDRPTDFPGVWQLPWSRTNYSISDLVKAGEAWSIDSDQARPQVIAVDPDFVAGWREGRLQYFNERLDVVAADLARYSGRQIIVGGEAARLRITGVLSEKNIDGWLLSLETTLPVRVLHRPDSTVSIEYQNTNKAFDPAPKH